MAATQSLTPDAARLLHALGETADGLVAVAPGGSIISWNTGAEELLGFTEQEVVGKACYEVFSWLDRCGNPVCSASCPACHLPGDEEPVRTRDVVARSKTGMTVWLSVSTLVPPPELRLQCRLVHLFREVALPPELERLVAERLQPPSTADAEGSALLKRLTAREREVLQLLADGADTREIASRLTLSLATVRNHVQNILAKLGVHSRLEAVVLFVRHGA